MMPKRISVIIGLTLFLFFILLLILPDIKGMFSSIEASNNVKLGHLKSYLQEFKDWKTLLFGQGLGSYFYSGGYHGMTSNTELTYLEIIRRFGIIFGGFLIGLMFYPLLAIKKSNFNYVWLFLAYGCYLFMISFNPFFFSSTGMIILSIVLYKMDQLKREQL